MVSHPAVVLLSVLALSRHGAGFTITTSEYVTTVLLGIFNDPAFTLSRFSGQSLPLGSAGTFTGGPFGIRNGAILTTGAADGPVNVNDGSIDDSGLQGANSDQWCASGSRNTLILSAQVHLDAAYSGFTFEYIFATNEPVRYVLCAPIIDN
jgi:hypothetical protein